MQNIKQRRYGIQFKRQVPTINYIVDFYCHEIGLAIKIDRISYDHSYNYDSKRQKELEKYNVKFLRFSNDEVKKNMFSVLLAIEESVKKLSKS